MQRFCSLHILVCLAYLLLVHISSSDEVKAYALCDSNDVFKCANLGNISAPFRGDSECAASKSFVISNCSFGQASWEAFEEAVHYDDDTNLGAPKLIGINKVAGNTYINLTWAPVIESTDQGKCVEPLLSQGVDQILPDLINLTTFANGSFRFSSYNYFLLFDCGGNPTDVPNLVVESALCASYKGLCDIDLPCMQLKPVQELALHATLDKLSCSHFMFIASGTIMISDPLWRTSTIQLVVGDLKCKACSDSGGQCYFNKETRNFEQCICGANNFSSTNCNNIDRGCLGVLSCNRIGIAVGLTVVSALLIILTLCWIVKAKLLKKPEEVITSKHPFPYRDLDNLTERPIEMSYSSLVSATDNFINTLGEGGFGVVYKGSLTAGVHIAVKVVAVASEHRKKHFLTEVATIGRIHHVHVVRLLGFCMEEQRRILVYEYVNNGSLDRWLFKHENDPFMFLYWQQRYDIALGIAKGLGYLHEECRHRIIHRDIKPQNILLDQQLCPKIADFGLAKLMARDESPAATLATGTPGYIAPEFWMAGEGQISTKADVYSYGMVLLELISGHQNFKNGSCFPEEAFEAAINGDIQSIIDVKLGITMPADDELPISNTMEEWQQVRTALFVALWCIQDRPMNRPHMSEVVLYLEGKIAIDENPPRPAIASILLSLSRPQSCHSNHQGLAITPVSGR
ncbi:hypothetical protein GOP47_0008650 [Adiantum capillus-veneris]|uniref:Protein kinase domain-containing protein n=1 Tax=Adiantum capillus-veneris TaxID=13818 RepID=A0A9D4ZKX6_ADICA|nr:hypothetical protein GOP47_0008650 [Adiantum capillus-veneris]